MRKIHTSLGSAAFFLLAPGTVAFLIPWWIAGWRMVEPFFGQPSVPFVGLLLVVAGAVPLIESFARFALVGRGTPAPIVPTERLVVSGFYRYERNPMYVGVLAIIIGNALVLGNASVLIYAVIVSLGFALFVRAYEEPALRRQFGQEYELYCTHVPRWLPRLTPWTPARKE